jgi:hypothetical protein
MNTTSKLTQANFTRISSDYYGNPRYYLPIYLAKETIARKLGGVKYRGKQYGAGWVFQSYNIQGVCDGINATDETLG